MKDIEPMTKWASETVRRIIKQRAVVPEGGVLKKPKKTLLPPPAVRKVKPKKSY